MNGPQDGRSWRHVDTAWPEFGLSTNGVNPFGQQQTNHSTWPITLVLYNLPSFLVIRRCYILLSTIIPGIAHTHKHTHSYLYMYTHTHTFTDGIALH